MFIDTQLIRYEKMEFPFVIIGMGFAFIFGGLLYNITDMIYVGIALTITALATGYLFKNELCEVLKLADTIIEN